MTSEPGELCVHIALKKRNRTAEFKQTKLRPHLKMVSVQFASVALLSSLSSFGVFTLYKEISEPH